MKASLALLLMASAAGRSLSDNTGTGQWWFTGDARAIMATVPRALDSLDSFDIPAFKSPYWWVAGSYHRSGEDGWDGDTGFYSYDYRAPLLPDQTKTWLLYVWAVPGHTAADFHCGWSEVMSGQVLGRLEYVQRPPGITGGPALGTVWTSPPKDFTLPYYASADGLTGYGFTFTLTMTPEPASVLAVAVGLCGLMLRRRRQ